MLALSKILGDASDARFADRMIDTITITWSDATKGRLRLKTEAGTDVGLTLERGSYLRDGAVLHDDGKRIIVVRRQPEEALIVRFRPDSPPVALVADAIRLGHAFGNHHVPIEVKGLKVTIPITTSREVVTAMLANLAITTVEVEFAYVPLAPERPPVTGPHVH